MPNVVVYLSDAGVNGNTIDGDVPIAVLARQVDALQQQFKQQQVAEIAHETLQTKVIEQTAKAADDLERRLLAIETRLNLERKFKSSPPRSPR